MRECVRGMDYLPLYKFGLFYETEFYQSIRFPILSNRRANCLRIWRPVCIVDLLLSDVFLYIAGDGLHYQVRSLFLVN